MKKLFPIMLFMGLLASGAAKAEDTNVLSGTDLKSFRLITERNIFNPNRSGRSAAGPKPKPVIIETFNLVGASTHEKGRQAFFDGSSSSFRKVLKVGDSIAGFKVIEIAMDRVKLVPASGKAINLYVGSQMKRQDEGEWFLNSSVEPTRMSSSAPTNKTSADEKTESTPSSGSESDVLKRLMQQREQELNK